MEGGGGRKTAGPGGLEGRGERKKERKKKTVEAVRRIQDQGSLWSGGKTQRIISDQRKNRKRET